MAITSNRQLVGGTGVSWAHAGVMGIYGVFSQQLGAGGVKLLHHVFYRQGYLVTRQKAMAADGAMVLDQAKCGIVGWRRSEWRIPSALCKSPLIIT